MTQGTATLLKTLADRISPGYADALSRALVTLEHRAPEPDDGRDDPR